MINIPIDAYSSIIQPYYDGGESYKDHFKYSLVNRYKQNPEGCFRQSWDSACVDIEANSISVIEADDLNVDISDFDRFRIFGLIPKSIHVKLYCNDELVIDERASGVVGYIDGSVKTNQTVVKKLRYEFKNYGSNAATASIHYLGMLSDKPKNKPAFTEEWEGFFAENPSYELFNNNLIDDCELSKIREKIKTEPYKGAYEAAREIAMRAMSSSPEAQIGRTMTRHFRTPYKFHGASELAIVGQIEKNPEMLKMACRYALSIGCCEYWCEDDMETIPMITWHHRSFTEADMIREVSIVLSMAGGLLSWHGRNFLYNMIIMKGLPRIEADFMTMEYIYNCNQGIVFMSGYIQGLLAVVDRYPRYASKINEAKIIIAEMFEKSFEADGSYAEGAIYWNFIMRRYLTCVYFLARYEKKSLRDLLGESLDKTAGFGMSMISEAGTFLTFADGNEKGSYSMMIPALLYLLTKKEQWASLFKKTETVELLDMVIAAAAEVPDSDVRFVHDFSYFPDMGYVQIYRDGILFATLSGKSNATHAHCDKGSFIIHKNGKIVVPDCCDRYDKAEAINLYKTEYHSLAIPVIDGEYVEQFKGNSYASVVEKAQYDNGIFEFCCDNSGMWNSDAVIKSKRTVISEKADEFVITDEFEFKKPCEIEFRINFRNEEDLEIEPLNWTPENVEISQIYDLDGVITYQKRLRSESLSVCKLMTKIKIL